MFQVVYAIENTYPEIKLLDGTIYVINENSTFVDYVSYAFMMIISIGAVILLGVLIWAGVNFIMAGGDPGKISKAKEMIWNGFIGMIILLSAYWILTTINPGIKGDDPDIDVCSMGGIVLEIDDGTKTTKKCMNESNGNIEGTIKSAEWQFEYGQVKEVWAFTGKDFTGTSTNIFQDGAGTYGCNVPGEIVKGTSISLSGAKSIYILPRLQGLYFYDKTNYGIDKELPFYVEGSISNISSTSRPSFDNKASSFSSVCSVSRIVEDSGVKKEYYNEPKAIIFENANYSGKCALVYSPKSNSLANASEPPDKTNNPHYIGNNTMSSIIVYNVNSETVVSSDKGRIILYNSLGCNKGTSTQNSMCEINVNQHQSYTINMKNKTANFGGFPTGPGCADWDGNSDIQSIEIPDGKGAVVVIGNNGTCAYFDTNKTTQGGNCVGDLRGTGVYEGGSIFGVRPVKVMIIPTN